MLDQHWEIVSPQIPVQHGMSFAILENSATNQINNIRRLQKRKSERYDLLRERNASNKIKGASVLIN